MLNTPTATAPASKPVTAPPDALKISLPQGQTVFTISDEPKWPSMLFATNFEGVPHTWKWTITWLRFRKSGQVTTAGNSWDSSEVLRRDRWAVNGTGRGRKQKSEYLGTAARNKSNS